MSASCLNDHCAGKSVRTWEAHLADIALEYMVRLWRELATCAGMARVHTEWPRYHLNRAKTY